TTRLAPRAGGSIAASAEGETVVQFRALDLSGNASSWAPAVVGASSTVRIDRTAPTTPTVAGGALTWRSVASIAITAGGSTDALNGVSGDEYRTSIDAGATWASPAAGPATTVTAEGQTLVQFQACDAVGNTARWTP